MERLRGSDVKPSPIPLRLGLYAYRGIKRNLRYLMPIAFAQTAEEIYARLQPCEKTDLFATLRTVRPLPQCTLKGQRYDGVSPGFVGWYFHCA